MKKIIFTVLAFCASILGAQACTNIIVGKAASADGSVLVSYNADSYGMFGWLYHYKAGTHAAGEMRQVYDWDSGRYIGQIPEAPITYNVIGNMNEFQVCITETTFGGREELSDKNGVVDYGSLIYIALQRSRTAKEALQIMTDLVAKYGYASSGESFSVCDKNEAWILEMIGKGTSENGQPTGAVWVAIRIPDDCISAHANQSRITTFNLKDKENVMASKDVISFARAKGLFNGKDSDFNFRDTYCPLDFGGIRACDARVWSVFRKFDNSMDQYMPYINGDATAPSMPLYIKPNRKVSLRDVKECMRDHYEGTAIDPTKDISAGPWASPYRPGGLAFKDADGNAHFNERPIGTQQTAFALVGQLRSWLPDALGGILWFNTDDATMITYVPVYCCTYEVPEAFSDKIAGPTEFSEKSAFWLNNMVSNYIYPRYSAIMPDLREAQKEMDDFFEADQKNVEQEVAQMNGDYLAKHLNDKTAAYTTQYMERWNKLFRTIIVKHNDYAVKGMKDGEFTLTPTGMVDGLTRPPYEQSFNNAVVEKTGTRYKKPEEKK